MNRRELLQEAGGGAGYVRSCSLLASMKPQPIAGVPVSDHTIAWYIARHCGGRQLIKEIGYAAEPFLRVDRA